MLHNVMKISHKVILVSPALLLAAPENDWIHQSFHEKEVRPGFCGERECHDCSRITVALIRLFRPYTRSLQSRTSS